MSAGVSCTISSFEVDYKPSTAVELSHQVPHLDNNLQNSEISFNSSFTNLASSNLMNNAQGFPLLIFFLVLTFTILLLIFLSTKCFWCIEIGPYAYSKGKRDGYMLEIITSRQRLAWAYSIFLFLAFFSASMSTIGNLQLRSGILSTQDALSSTSETFVDLSDAGVSIEQETDRLITDVLSATSCATGNITVKLTELGESMNNFVVLMDPVADELDEFNEDMSYYVDSYHMHMVFGPFIVACVVTLLLYASPTTQSMLLTRITIFVTILAIGVVSLLSGAGMLIGILLGDFCMDPMGNLVMACETYKPQSLHEITAYYSQCTGSNPLLDPLHRASTISVAIEAEIASLYNDVSNTNCYLDSSLQATAASVLTIDQSLDLISCSLSCDAIGPKWFDGLHSGFCTEIPSGLTVIWMMEYCEIMFLVITLGCGIVLSFYYGNWWSVDENTISPFNNVKEPEEEKSDSLHEQDTRGARMKSIHAEDGIEHKEEDSGNYSRRGRGSVGKNNGNEVMEFNHEEKSSKKGHHHHNQHNYHHKSSRENSYKEDSGNYSRRGRGSVGKNNGNEVMEFNHEEKSSKKGHHHHNQHNHHHKSSRENSYKEDVHSYDGKLDARYNNIRNLVTKHSDIDKGNNVVNKPKKKNMYIPADVDHSVLPRPNMGQGVAGNTAAHKYPTPVNANPIVLPRPVPQKPIPVSEMEIQDLDSAEYEISV